MVNFPRRWFVRAIALVAVLTATMGAAAGESQPLLNRLEPVLRARVMMALLGLVLVGLALVAGIVMGARYVRRIGGVTTTNRPMTATPSSAKPYVRSRPSVAKGKDR